VKTSGSKRIAERYVKALFEVVVADKATDSVEKDLLSLGIACKESPEFCHFLTNPLLSNEARAQTMLAILAKMQVHQITQQFVGMLIRQTRLAILPEIVSLFADWASVARGELKGEVIAAAPLKDKEIKLISERLSKAYDRKMVLSQKEQPDLLGGVVVKIGSLQLDSSLAGKIRRLKIALQVA
jgi:F-type H+-transporting ATPase subunit delta